MNQRPTKQDALGFYSDLLSSLLCSATQDGLLNAVDPDGNTNPLTLTEKDGAKKRLVLPTQQVMGNPDWSGKVAFHPLSESVYRGESAIIKKLKHLVNSRVNASFFLMVTEFLAIACDPEKHQTLSSKQTQLLECLPKADERTHNDLMKVVTNVGKEPDYQFINLYLKHGGRYKGKECSRLGVVSFPVLEFLDDAKKRRVFGVDLRVNDFAALKNLFLYIFPDADRPETYNHGVLSENNESAPYFRALLGIYRNLAKALNAKAHLFRKHLEEIDIIKIPMSWEPGLDHLEAFAEMFPPLQGNDGTMETPQPTQPGQTNQGNSPSEQSSWSQLKQQMGMGMPQQPPGAMPPQQPYQQAPAWLGGQPQPQQPMPPQPPQPPPGYYANDPRLAPQRPSWLGGGGQPQQPMQQQYPQQPMQQQYPQQPMQQQYQQPMPPQQPMPQQYQQPMQQQYPQQPMGNGQPPWGPQPGSNRFR